MKFITLLTISMTILFSTSHSFGAEKYKLASKSDVTKLAETVGSQSASNPYHFINLFDASSDSFFIPYQLWSGAKWDGVKSVEKCMHKANTTWTYFNPRNTKSKGKIISPVKYPHPSSGEVFQTFEWKGRKGSQNYICHSKGLARIYDHRFKKAGLLDSPILNGTECKFPAGFGWQIGVSQDCNPEAPKQTTVTELMFDENFNLVKMKYTYTEKEGFSAKVADDYYEYEVGKGRVLHKKLK
jgi:hypothetical protein